MVYTFGGLLRGNVPCPTCSLLIVTWQEICCVAIVIGLYRLQHTASDHPYMFCASQKSMCILKTVSRLLNHTFDARITQRTAIKQNTIKWSEHLHQVDNTCTIIEHPANTENTNKYFLYFVVFSIFTCVNSAIFISSPSPLCLNVVLMNWWRRVLHLMVFFLLACVF